MPLSVPLLVFAMVAGADSAGAAASNPQVVFHTNKGDIVIELWPDKAPKTVENFLSYSRSGFYQGTIFHRVIPGFVIQGGGFTADMEQKKTEFPIQNEADDKVKNKRGTLSMARTSNPHSATSQFFVNLRDNLSLDQPAGGGWGYAVFGEVVEGMEVVDAIAAVPTTRWGMHDDVPREPVVVETVTVR
jgi:peptidyl-prolyl cis-trans isomerase B (cyclophilin B)